METANLSIIFISVGSKIAMMPIKLGKGIFFNN